ncbi:MAG TPA: helix-turn-helix domain-containing protein [Kofleriaceae bacterium]|jgi:DNA-binding HxlR family transcriptional regulator|nr:helix-turn-helix domain-containing protein [Kofleriaceae bacterium]
MVTKPRLLSCDDLTDEQDALARQVLARSLSSWGMWTMHVIYAAAKPMRFSRIRDSVEGISQKVLTQTLRQLERDGLITRTVYPEVPPRVEYELTSLGRALLKRTLPAWNWIVTQVPKLERARAAFDTQRAKTR